MRMRLCFVFLVSIAIILDSKAALIDNGLFASCKYVSRVESLNDDAIHRSVESGGSYDLERDHGFGQDHLADRQWHSGLSHLQYI
jgi:hypothetical protein